MSLINTERMKLKDKSVQSVDFCYFIMFKDKKQYSYTLDYKIAISHGIALIGDEAMMEIWYIRQNSPISTFDALFTMDLSLSISDSRWSNARLTLGS